MLILFQRQIESAQAEKRFVIGKGQRDFHPFLVNFHTEDFEIRIHLPKTHSAFECGSRVKTVAEVNEQGLGKPAIGPREQRGLIEQNKIVDAAESIRSGLPARRLSLWFFGNT